MAGLFDRLGIEDIPQPKQPNTMAKSRFGLDTTKVQHETPKPTGLFDRLGIEDIPVDYVAQAKKIPKHLWNSLVTGVENAGYGTMYVINDPDKKTSVAAQMVNARFGNTNAAQKLTEQHIANEPMRAQQRQYYGGKIQQNDAANAQLTPYFNNDVLDGVYGGVASVVQQTPGIAASVALRNPAPMMGQIGLQTFGPEYARARESGASRGEAELSSLGKTALEVGTEYLPAAKGLKHLKGKGKLADAFLKQVAAEVPGELVAEAGQNAIDQHYGLNGRAAGDWNQYLDQLPSNLTQAGFGALSGSGLQAGGYHAANRLANRQSGNTPTPDKKEATPVAVDPVQRIQQIMQRAIPGANEQTAQPATAPVTKPVKADPVQAAMREVADTVYGTEAQPQQVESAPPIEAVPAANESRSATLRQHLAESALGDIAPALIDNGHIVLHDTADTLPVRPDGAVVQGLTTEDGKIHLVADQLTSKNAGAVALHEGFHEGGKSLIGDAAWNKLMGNLSTLHQRAQRVGGEGGKFWRDAQRSVERANVDAALTPEEFGAYAIEHYEQAPAGVKRWVDNTVGGMQAWVQQRFGKQVGQVTPGQLRALAVKALQQKAPAAPAVDGKFSVQQPEQRLIEAETGLQHHMRKQVNRMNRAEHIENQLQKMGVETPEWLSVSRAEAAYHGRRGERLADFKNRDVSDLAKTMAKNQVTPERLDWYALARHAEERNAHIASINEGMPDGGSGMTTQQANDLLAGKPVTMQVELTNKHGRVYKESVDVAGFSPAEIQRLAPVMQQLDAMTAKSRQLMKEYGLESADAVDAWSEQYKHYVPLAGKAGTSEFGGTSGVQSGFSVRGGQKRAAGRSSVAPNITEQVVRQVEDAIMRGEKNRVSSHVVVLAQQLQKQGMPEAANGKPLFEINPADLHTSFYQASGKPMSEFAADAAKEFGITREELTPDMLKEFVQNETAKAIKKPFAEVTKQDVDAYRKSFAGKVKREFENIVRSAPDIVTARVDGKDVPIRINDPALAEAVRNLDAPEMGKLMGFINKTTRMLSMTMTSGNPNFWLKAFARDVFTVSAYGRRFGPGITRKALNPIRLSKSVIEAFRQEITGRESQRFEDFRLNGGRTGFAQVTRDLGKKRADLVEAIKAAGPLNKDTAPAKVKHVLGKLWDYYLAAGNSFESGMRYSAYQAALEVGHSPERAAQVAKEITLNFNRKGSGEAAQTLNALFAFYNASLQGVRTGVIAMQDRRVQVAVLGLMSIMFLSEIVLLSSLDDDEREDLLNNPTFRDDRIENILIPTFGIDFGKDRPYLKIPTGPDLAFLAGISGAMADLFYGGKGATWKATASVGQGLSRTFTPPPFSDVVRAGTLANKGDETKAMIVADLPTALKPAVQSATNINYMGQQVVPENNFERANPDAYKARRRTRTGWASDLAVWMNEKTGGNRAVSGYIDVSPETINHWIRGYTGGIGSFMSQGSDAISNPQKDILDLPIISGFIANPDALERGRTNRAREVMDRVGEQRAQAKRLKEEGYQEEAQATLDKMRESEGDLAKIALNAEERLSALNKKENRLGRRKDEEAMQQRAEIETKRKDIYQRINQAARRQNP